MAKKILDEPMPPGWKRAEIKPQYWHEWGNEPRGKVSTFAYDANDDYHFTGYYDKIVAEEAGLKFLSPFN